LYRFLSKLINEGKQPTVYRWIIWSLRSLQLKEIELIWIISPKKIIPFI